MTLLRPTARADLANLTTDNIERIEVVRGPLSALYGSNATAGVINIITKKGRGKPSLYVGSEYGAYNTWKTYGGASGQWEMLNFSFSAAQTETDGFSAADDRNNAIAGGPNTAEDDGWKNTTLSGKFGVDITDNFDINATVRNISAEVDIDDSNGYAADQWDYNTYPYTLVPYGTKNKKRKTISCFTPLTSITALGRGCSIPVFSIRALNRNAIFMMPPAMKRIGTKATAWKRAGR